VSGTVTDQYDAFTKAASVTSSLHEQNYDPTHPSSSNHTTHDSHLTQRYSSLATLTFIYQGKAGNVLTQESIADIRAIEQRFIASNGYSDRCLLEYKDYRTVVQGYYPLPDNEKRVLCARPASAMNMFYPTLNSSEPRHYALYDLYDFNGNGTSMYSIPDIANAMALSESASWYLSRNFTIWNHSTSVLRSQFTFGAPVPPYTSLDDIEAQKKEFSEWIIPFSKVFSTWSTSNVRLLWQGTGITDWEVTQLIKRDSLFCIGSVFLVLFWMIFHFRSVVLALIGMLNILAAIPVGHFVTHIIMGNKYLGLLMTLPIFIILGIGCDDVFVFFDAWKASGTQGVHISGHFETRLDWTYRRAVSSMIVTSLTSAATFFIAAISPVPPIRTFGIAMGSTILANLFLVTTFFPAALLLWHKYLEHRFTWGNSLAALSDVWWKPDEDPNASPRRNPEQLRNPTSIIVSMSDVSIVQDVKDGEDLAPQPLPELELDKNPYMSKKNKKKRNASPQTPVKFSTANGNSQDLESGATTDEEQDGEGGNKAIRVVSKTTTGVKVIVELDEEPLADPWKLSASGRWFYFNFVPFVHGLRWIVMLVAFVLLVLCFAAAFYLEPHRGSPRFFPVGSNLNDFDNLVENVFNLDDNSYSEVNLVWGINGIDRSQIDLSDPVAVGTTTWDTTFNLSDPSAQQFLINVFENAKVAHVGDTESAFLINRNMQLHKSFMSAFRTFRLSRNQTFPVSQPSEFWTGLKEWLQSEDGDLYNSQLGWTTETKGEEQTLKWCSMTLRSNIVPATASNKDLKTYLEAWSAFLTRQKVQAPASAKNGFATCYDFVWVQNMQALIMQASWGTLGAVIIALVVLLLVTWNLIVSIYAILSIGMVVMLVVGFMSVAGWDLGIMEFVSLTIVVGVSIGFSVHISMAYLTYARHAMLKDKPRVSIVQYTMAEMGSPLISGAVTTATAVLMLFFCKITLFSHFGKFLFVNIIASLATSFFLLVTFLILFGPRGDFGSIHGLIAWNKERQRKAREKKRLKESLAAAKNAFTVSHNLDNPDPNSQVEMTPIKTPARLNVAMSHGLSLNESTSSLGTGTPLRSSVSMSDFELQLDDEVPHFDLDASLSTRSPARAIDMPDDEDEDDEPVRLTPIKPRGLPKPDYTDDSDDSEPESLPPSLRF
jgi:preprotein translocase subunit SecF